MKKGKQAVYVPPKPKKPKLPGVPLQQRYPHLVVLDFEATCLENTKIVPQEIIEFPSVLINTSTLEIEDQIQIYVKPVHNPQLSPFCKQLTGIQQQWVDDGVLFEEAYQRYNKWLEEKGLLTNPESFIIITCGDWDLKTMLPGQLQLQPKTPRLPHFQKWINVKKLFSKCYQSHAPGMVGLLNYFQLDLEGKHHSGIDDCKNIARIVLRMLQDGCIFEITNKNM